MKEELDAYTTFDVIRVTESDAIPVLEPVATEVPLTIVANDIEIATLLVSPFNIKELVYGYLFTSGFITGCTEIKNYWLDKKNWSVSVDLARQPDIATSQKRLYTASCGKCAMYASVYELALRKKLESSIIVEKERIFRLIDKLETGSDLFRKTGAVHTAILANEEEEIVIDDIARHNTVDKVIGRALLENKNLSTYILARTGRTSSEIVYKARRCGIPVTIARGAPTHQAIYLCKEMGITLVGFGRKRSFNVYTHPERIAL